jgi:hypothetical protein
MLVPPRASFARESSIAMQQTRVRPAAAPAFYSHSSS